MIPSRTNGTHKAPLHFWVKLLSRAVSLLFAGVLLTIRCANASDSPPAVDPAFSAGLATLKQAIGFVEDPRSPTDWKPHLTRVEIIVGPAHGAEMLLTGIRSIRAAHPT